MQIKGSKNTLYFDTQKQVLLSKDDLYEKLSIDIIRKSSVESHHHNSSQYVDRPDTYMNVLPQIVPIPRESNWHYRHGKFTHDPMINQDFEKYENATTNIFKEKLVESLSKYKGETIGVESSGGLDSSITLSLLENQQFDLFLIGVQHNRYEFRSEITIQNLYAQKYPNHLYLVDKSHFPYQNLRNAPIHPLPSTISLFHEHHQITANECQKRKCKLVLSGHGGDAIFILEVGQNPLVTYQNCFLPWMLDDGWVDEFIYQPRLMSYKSAYNLDDLSPMISVCRKNQKEDLRKEWARNFFKKDLPKELVHYQYKTSNDGVYYEGLELATPDLLEIFTCAYEVTKNNIFKPNHMEEMIYKHLSYQERNLNLITSYASYAVWIYTLIQHKLIS
jgi:asparagine synthetase B (glutamine-hydrolysing)